MKRYLRASNGIIITAIFITLLFCPGLLAAEEALPTPEEIMAKNIEAIGGIKALNKIKNRKNVLLLKNYSMRILNKNQTDDKGLKSGSKDEKSNEPKGTRTITYMEHPSNYYQSDDKGYSSGSNGKMAWMKDPHNGTRLLEGDQLSYVLSVTKFRALEEIDAPCISMKTEGIEQINGKDCYRVRKTLESGPEEIVFFDKKSFIIVKKTINYNGNNKLEQYFENYQKVNNIFFPFKQVDFINGQRLEEKVWEKRELNIEMPEGIFDFPEEVKAIMTKNETEQHAQQ